MLGSIRFHFLEVFPNLSKRNVFVEYIPSLEKSSSVNKTEISIYCILAKLLLCKKFFYRMIIRKQSCYFWRCNSPPYKVQCILLDLFTAAVTAHTLIYGFLSTASNIVSSTEDIQVPCPRCTYYLLYLY